MPQWPESFSSDPVRALYNNLEKIDGVGLPASDYSSHGTESDVQKTAKCSGSSRGVVSGGVFKITGNVINLDW